MNVNERVVGHGLKHVLDNEPVNTCYLLDQQGKEVAVTTAMIRSTCYQLLQRCRTPKK
ncbi:MAG TPA: hypothetical protein PLR79_01665 [Acinetobacter sp.]|nr:hypothetical protein [Acinetobacter sp.]HRA90886.1 hypothetical protein [Acinetobacter sp.]